ncbi:hypothetical protein [Paraburkholderia saeva]|uniref:Uncharacterized protein n=1 Tax=Paraburkholderia saeva TaxID=2777537 RepID=A0A9N8X591_9BURK|nr:hypothetical protein [Paraburkholderia saeva]CAG4928212.1 hypothetical protein LMG31841_05788 [Paraburkholderia saeva]
MKTKTLLLALCAALPLTAHAYKLDRTMDCSMTVRDFFTPLVQAHAIQTPASMIGPKGANYFKKTSDNALTFFNMTVGWVVGYTNEPLLFTPPSDGTIPNFQGYGFYLQAPIAEVQATLASVGATAAQVRRIEPNVTYVYCEFPAAE